MQITSKGQVTIPPELRKRHGRAMNDIFTQVLELARSLGLGKRGPVAIDSTRIAANASISVTDSLGNCARNAPGFARTSDGGSSRARATIRTKEPDWRWRARR